MSTEIFLKHSIPADGPDETIGRLSRHFIVRFCQWDETVSTVRFDWNGQWYTVPTSNVLGVITKPQRQKP